MAVIKDNEIAHIRARLVSLAAERVELESRLHELERQSDLFAPAKDSVPTADPAHVTTASTTTDKVALFRRLFAGRSEYSRFAGRTRRLERRVTPQLAATNG